jgi:hypothetical protein
MLGLGQDAASGCNDDTSAVKIVNTFAPHVFSRRLTIVSAGPSDS